MKTIIAIALCLGSLAWGQRNELGVYATGNLNPQYIVNLEHGANPILGSNKSTWGYGFSYDRFWGNFGAGFLYEQNPKSDGKLVVPDGCCSLLQAKTYIWPLDRWDLAALATYRMPVGKSRWTVFAQAGPGWVITNGGSNSGVSEDFALVSGLGVDYRIRSRWKLRAGETFLNTHQGCYGDPTCSETWSLIQDLRVGVVTTF